jgi:hypothetical protein
MHPLSQPITGDSHQHLIAPLVALASELGYAVEIHDLDGHGPCGWCDPKVTQTVIASGTRWSATSEPASASGPLAARRSAARRPRHGPHGDAGARRVPRQHDGDRPHPEARPFRHRLRDRHPRAFCFGGLEQLASREAFSTLFMGGRRARGSGAIRAARSRTRGRGHSPACPARLVLRVADRTRAS